MKTDFVAKLSVFNFNELFCDSNSSNVSWLYFHIIALFCSFSQFASNMYLKYLYLDNENTIRKHWKYLLEHILPQIRSLKDHQPLEISTEGVVTNNNSNENENANSDNNNSDNNSDISNNNQPTEKFYTMSPTTITSIHNNNTDNSNTGNEPDSGLKNSTDNTKQQKQQLLDESEIEEEVVQFILSKVNSLAHVCDCIK